LELTKSYLASEFAPPNFEIRGIFPETGIATVLSLIVPPASFKVLRESSHRSHPMRILAMTLNSVDGALTRQQTIAATTVTISPWVNESLPNIHEILCSRDLARLTRRPRWILCGLALIGKFPRKKRYRGRLVGWSRTEVLEWMTSELAVETEGHERLNVPLDCADRHPRQGCLPFDCPKPRTATGTNAQNRERNR
jgi:hypothetical protein